MFIIYDIVWIEWHKLWMHRNKMKHKKISKVTIVNRKRYTLQYEWDLQ